MKEFLTFQRSRTTPTLAVATLIVGLTSCDRTSMEDRKQKIHSVKVATENLAQKLHTIQDTLQEKYGDRIRSNQNLKQLLSELRSSNLRATDSFLEIPPVALNFLNEYSGGFWIADPDEQWQDGCIVTSPLPPRKLKYLGIGDSILLMTYDRSFGIATASKAIIVKYDSAQAVDFWAGSIGAVKNRMDKILDLLEQASPVPDSLKHLHLSI